MTTSPAADLLSKLDEAVRDGNSAIAAHVESIPSSTHGHHSDRNPVRGNRLGLVHIGDSRVICCVTVS